MSVEAVVREIGLAAHVPDQHREGGREAEVENEDQVGVRLSSTISMMRMRVGVRLTMRIR